MKLYVLKLKDDCWYVGISKDPIYRISQHRGGTGAAWCKKHEPLGGDDNYYIVDLGDLNIAECEKTEDDVTEELQKEFGLNKVRGGYTIMCRNLTKFPNRYKAKWLYNQVKYGFRGRVKSRSKALAAQPEIPKNPQLPAARSPPAAVY